MEGGVNSSGRGSPKIMFHAMMEKKTKPWAADFRLSPLEGKHSRRVQFTDTKDDVKENKEGASSSTHMSALDKLMPPTPDDEPRVQVSARLFFLHSNLPIFRHLGPTRSTTTRGNAD